MPIGSDYQHSRDSRLFKFYFKLFGTPDLHTHLRLSSFLSTIESATKTYGISQIFEPGCGRGINLFEIVKRGVNIPYFGNDFNVDDIDAAQKISDKLALDHAEFSHADATNAIPKDKNYNAVLLLDIVEHIEDDRAFVQAITENAADDCVFFVSVPTKNYPKTFGRKYHEKVGHVREGYTLEELEAVFQSAGARMVAHSYSTGRIAKIGCFIYYRLNSNSNILNALLGLLVMPFRYLDKLNSRHASCSLFCIFVKGHSDK